MPRPNLKIIDEYFQMTEAQWQWNIEYSKSERMSETAKPNRIEECRHYLDELDTFLLQQKPGWITTASLNEADYKLDKVRDWLENKHNTSDLTQREATYLLERFRICRSLFRDLMPPEVRSP